MCTGVIGLGYGHGAVWGVCVRGSIGAIQWESSSFRVADMEAQYCTQYINININTNTGVSAG